MLQLAIRLVRQISLQLYLPVLALLVCIVKQTSRVALLPSFESLPHHVRGSV